MNPKYIFYAIIGLFYSLTLYFWLDDRFEDAVISGIIMIGLLQLASIFEKASGLRER